MKFRIYCLEFIILYVYSIPNYIDLIDLSSSSYFHSSNGDYSGRIIIRPYTYNIYNGIPSSCEDNNEDHYCRYYKLIGTSNCEGINFGENVIIFIDSINMIYSGNLPPIIIEKNSKVTFNISGVCTIADSSSNELNGTIYLSEGAILKIIGNGTLNIFANKKMAIKGANSSNLLINGVNINIYSIENDESMIYVGGNFEFKDAIFNYKSIYGEKYNFNCENEDAIPKELFNLELNTGNIIQAEDSIYIQSGIFNMKAGKGKALKAGQNIYLGGIYENNLNLNIKIESLGEGIESNSLEIFSGTLSIKSAGVGINLLSDIISSKLKIYDGDININSNENPILSDNIYIMGGKLVLFGDSKENYESIIHEGIMNILKGAIIIGYSNYKGGLILNNIQYYMEYKENINSGLYIEVFNKENGTFFETIEIPKNINYLYFTFPFNYSIELKEKEELNIIRSLKTSQANEIIDSTYTLISKEKGENIFEKENTSEISGQKENEERKNICNNIKSPIIYILLNIIIIILS